MLIIFNFAIEKLLDFLVEVCEAFLFLCVWEVHGLICTWCTNVEFGVKYIDTGCIPAKTWHGECVVALILSGLVFAASLINIKIKLVMANYMK
jgi:hypothetical protein